MKSVSSCPACGILSLLAPGGFCPLCFDEKLIPAGGLLEALDIAAMVAAEGDSIVEECARALDMMEGR